MKKFHLVYLKLIFDARHWIYFIVGLALLSALVGGVTVIAFPSLWPAFVIFLHKTFESLLGDIQTQTHLQTAVALFKQNLTATLFDLFGGVFFGLIPVVSIAFNFFAIGFLGGPYLAFSRFPGIPGDLPMFFLAIVPHGIFEFPALILASAFGLRLGWAWLLPGSAGKRKIIFGQAFSACLQILPLVIVLLILAAFIEAFFTSWLVQ